MQAKGYLTETEAQAALAENVRIAPKNNAFLEQAPHFTEHVRRYLVDKYGEEKVLNQGLQVRTTCDLDLQRAAQEAVSNGVFEVDQRMGFRRDAITHVSGDEAIAAKRAELETAMRKRWASELNVYFFNGIPGGWSKNGQPCDKFHALLRQLQDAFEASVK